MKDLAQIRPESFFADRFNVTASLMEKVLGSSLIGRVDDADIYLEYCINEDLQLEEGAVKKASRHVSQGAGVVWPPSPTMFGSESSEPSTVSVQYLKEDVNVGVPLAL